MLFTLLPQEIFQSFWLAGFLGGLGGESSLLLSSGSHVDTTSGKYMSQGAGC